MLPGVRRARYEWPLDAEAGSPVALRRLGDPKQSVSEPARNALTATKPTRETLRLSGARPDDYDWLASDEDRPLFRSQVDRIAQE